MELSAKNAERMNKLLGITEDDLKKSKKQPTVSTQGTRPQGLNPAYVAASIADDHDRNENKYRQIADRVAADHAGEDVKGARLNQIAQNISQHHDWEEDYKTDDSKRLRAGVFADDLLKAIQDGTDKDLQKDLAYKLRAEATTGSLVNNHFNNTSAFTDEELNALMRLYNQATNSRFENAISGAGAGIAGNITALAESLWQEASDSKAYIDQYEGDYWKDFFTKSPAQMQADREAAGYGIRPLDEDSFSRKTYGISQDLKSAATAGLSEDGLGDTKYFSPKWMAEQGISLAENAPNLLMSAVNPALGSAYMVANAGGGRAMELAEQGVGTQAAITRGLISGGIEALTEKFSIDNWMNALTNNKGVLMNILGQMGVEASEESASYVLNYIADKAAKDPNAQFSWNELMDSAIGGAFSGGIYGGIGQIGRKGAEQAQRTLGENSRKNYEKAKEEDAGRTPDFDRQFDHYNKMGELGIEFEQIPEIASATPVSDAVKQGAYLTGKNDGVERATKLADRALAGETLTDAEIDSVLGHKETRQHFESAAGVKFSKSNAKNRTTVREYAEAEQKKPRLVKNDFSKEFGAETEDMLDRLAKRGGAQIEIVESIADGSAGKYLDGKIQISAEKLREDREGTLRAVVMHEMTHHIETSGQYEQLKSGIESYLKSKGVDVDYELEILAEEYEANGVDLLEDDRIWREYIAKNVETLLSDEDSVRYLARENRGLFDKIREFLRDLVMKIKGTQDEKTVRELLKIYDHALDTVDAHPENRLQGEQHELYSDFSELFQVWYDSKKPYERLTDGGYFKIGTTSEALKSIGVRDGEIVWRKHKIGYIMEDHSEMSPEVIKQVPGVLENPVAVLKSKTRDDSIVLFGDVVAENGNKVMAALELTPSAAGKMEADFSLLTSAYSRSDSNIRNLVENSETLYLDENKKRTDTWLMSLGVQFPSDQPSYGSIGSIEYSNKSVKVKGVPFTGIFTKFEDKTSATVSPQDGSNAIRNSGQTSVGRSIDELRAQGQNMTPEERKAYVEASRERRAKLRELSEKYGEIPKGERPAREIAMPQQTNDDTRVRRFARTAAEASVLSDEQAGAIEQAVLDGVFDYEPIGDQSAVERAEAKILRDAEQAKRDWVAVVNSNDRITKNDIALGELLLKQAAEEGNTDEVIRLTAEIAAAGTQAGQVVQAMRLLKQMGGAGQLAGIQQAVNRYQKDLEARGKNAKRKTADGKLSDAKTVGKENKDAVKKHTRKAKEHAVNEARAKAEEINKENIPLEDWPKETGNLLAKRLANRVTPPKHKDKTVCQTILGDLTKFAAEHSLPKLKTAKDVRGAADVLREYFDHKDFYTKAYKQAQQQLRETYKDDPDMLDRFEDFLNSTIDYNGDPMHSQTVMVEAMLKHVSDNSSKNLVETAALLGTNRAAKNLADKLVADVGVSGANETIVRDAVNRLVTEMYIEKAGSKKLGKIVKAAIKEVSVKMSVLAEAPPAERDAALQKVAAEIVNKYGFANEDADIAVAIVAEEFTAYLDEVTQKKLKQIFGERKIRANREFWDIFYQYGRLGAFNSQYADKAAAKLFGDGSIRIDPDLADALLNAKTEEEIEKAKEALLRDVAGQIPGTWGDKWNAWRYLAMLGNPRTHIRNVLGNALFEPMVGVKNVLGAIAETFTDPVVKKVRGRGIERTKTLKPANRAVKDFAKADYAEMEEIVKHGGKYNDGQKIDDYRTIFTNKAIEWARKANGKALEKEDGIFLGRHYTRALASYITANNLDVAKLGDGSRESAKLLDKARAYAIREAQKATYRDASQTAELIAQTARRGKAPVRMVLEGVLPFKKTPINILKRGVEYSPAGLVKAVYKGVDGLKNGGYTANEFIDDLAAGLSGSALLGLGYMMTSMGLLSGGGDDEDESKWFKDMLGYQSYALRAGDTTYTLDWMAPGSMPLFVGVELFNLKHGDKLDAKDMLQAMELVTAPLNNMSMLSGLNDTLDNLAYGGDTDNALMNLFTDSVLSYLSQAVPTLGGQVARTMDGTRRTTYADPNNAMPDSWEKALQKAGNKIPYLSEKNPAYINLWGETEETENPLYRFVTNALSPGYVDTIEMDKLDEELLRLYEATGENVFPDSAGKSIRVDNETKKFTVDEFRTYATALGQTSHEVLYGLTDSKQYRNADDTDKVAGIDMAYQYARALAKTEVSDYEMDGWIAKAHEGASVDLSPEDYILYKLTCLRTDADQNGSITQEEAKKAIDSMDGLNKKQKAYLWQSQNKSWKANKNPYK